MDFEMPKCNNRNFFLLCSKNSTDLHDLERGRVETVGHLHDLLPGLPKHIVPDVALVGGEVELQPLHVGPLPLSGREGEGS